MTIKNYFTKKRFRNQEESLQRLLQKDPEFAELCEDYEICMTAAEYWSGRRESGAVEKAKEFRDIAGDIEADISKTLTECEP